MMLHVYGQEILSDEELSDDVRRSRFQIMLGNTIGGALRATELAPHMYENWLLLARVYEALVPFT